MYSGFLNINKGSGYSSNKSLFAVKKVLRQRAITTKVGHLGTLDPLACGVLPVALGRATRLFDFSLNKEKKYVARFRFGCTSASLDLGTEVIPFAHFSVKKEDIEEKLSLFIGEIDQLPPSYSAKSIGGVRAYKLARKGEEFVLPSKKVTVKDFSLLSQTDENEFEFEIICGSGTYIRSLARDIGEAVGSAAIMTYLCRTKSGPFSLGNSITEENLLDNEECLEKNLLPVDYLLTDLPKIFLGERDLFRITNGIHIEGDYPNEAVLYDEKNELIGLVGKDEDGLLRINTRLI